jgi:hypothetical protein
MVMEVEKKNTEKRGERKCSVKWIANEQGCEKKYQRWCEGLTSGMMKLTAILPRRRSLRVLELVKKEPRRRSWSFLNSAAAGKVRLELWNGVMGKEYPRRNYL